MNTVLAWVSSIACYFLACWNFVYGSVDLGLIFVVVASIITLFFSWPGFFDMDECYEEEYDDEYKCEDDDDL